MIIQLLKNIYKKTIKRRKIVQVFLIRNRAQKAVRRAFSNSKIPPVFVYSMGKVGSRSVYDSLVASSLENEVLHLHFLSADLQKHIKTHKKAGVSLIPYHLILGKSVRKQLLQHANYPMKVITLVRDPIALIASILFEPPYFETDILAKDGKSIDSSKATLYLKTKLEGTQIFEYIYEWFNKEVKTVFDLDIFSTPFSKSEGYTIYRKNNLELLLIRLEDLSKIGDSVISNFLNSDIALRKTNIRSESKNSDKYKEVLDNLHLPVRLCEEIYNSEFVRHFYASEKINAFKQKWTGTKP